MLQRSMQLSRTRQRSLAVLNDVTHLRVLQAGLTVCTPVFNTLLRLTAQDGASAATLEDMLEDALNRGILPSQSSELLPDVSKFHA